MEIALQAHLGRWLVVPGGHGVLSALRRAPQRTAAASLGARGLVQRAILIPFFTWIEFVVRHVVAGWRYDVEQA